ncbi:MAG: glycosyl hydrolase, partial [Verrucomicrobiota bacterium]
TGAEAARLGLRVDMATGTGWPFGGPAVDSRHAAQQVLWRDGKAVVEPTGQQVKRAAPGGEGLVLDPFSEAAIDAYLARFDRAFAELPAKTLRAQFHDSFEYYGANWTEALPERFARMHGYALESVLPALFDEADDPVSIETRARLKHDYRLALDALHQEYLTAWREWAHRHGWLTRNQSHGAPANLLDLYAIADIPETEVFGSTPFPIPGLRREADSIRGDLDLPEPLVTRMASSAAHVMGKPLASSETATWLRDHWKVSLAMVKPEVDRLFLDGINHVFYHGAVYSPPEVPWPGWLFYASTQFNPRNPWWGDFGALNAYVERVQRVLQGGRPDNDVLLYWPASEIWQDAGGGLAKQLTVHHVDFVLERPFGVVARELKEAGYAFDYLSDRQIEGLTVEDGALVAPGGHYATLVVPPTALMPVATLERLLGLVRAGATVVFVDWPEDVPGWGGLAARRAVRRELIEAVPAEVRATGGALGLGRVLVGDVVSALADTRARREPLFETGLEAIRRRTPAGVDYFIANLTATAFDGWITLGAAPQAATLLDPLSGEGGVAALRVSDGEGVQLRLQLAPGESIVARTLQAGEATGPAWRYLEPAGAPRTLEGPWVVDFVRGGPVLPAARSMETLSSWATWEDPEARRFAGTARYTTSFALEAVEAAKSWRLDLGELRDSARVFLNGRYVGTVWSLPFHLRLTDHLRAGENTLMLEVTNTAANRVRDLDRRGVDWKIMHEINFVDIRYRPFDASEWALRPAGLLGPVQLVPLRAAAE